MNEKMKAIVRFLSKWAWEQELSELAYWQGQLDSEPEGVLLVPTVDGGTAVPLRAYNLAIMKLNVKAEAATSARSDATVKTLLADFAAYVRASPCACEPLFDDQPDGVRFGPLCERCKLVERADELKLNVKATMKRKGNK